jgi:GTPase
VKHHKFIETVNLTLIAGNGGSGAVSFKRKRGLPKGIPDGGYGGKGADIILKADQSVQSLTSLAYNQTQKADDGETGGANKQSGHNASALEIKIPCGTEIYDQLNNEKIADFTAHGQSIIIARGGEGGVGNAHLPKKTHNSRKESLPYGQGETQKIRLEFKIISDVCLIGLPNAGKSSILKALSNAKPEIADYPFTTRYPVLGTFVTDVFKKMTVVEIPAIVNGSSKGKGLGNHYLRHARKTGCIGYIIDAAEDKNTLPILINEVKAFNAEMVKLPSFIIANKTDLLKNKQVIKKFRQNTNLHTIPVSAKTQEGINELKKYLSSLF